MFNERKKSLKFPSLNQGTTFKKYQKKIDDNLVKKKEGFSNMDLTQKTNSIIERNTYSGNEQEIVASLQQEYQSTLQEYQTLSNKISGKVSGYFNRVNPDNPFLNKFINFSNGNTFYVTNQGVAKFVPSADILNSMNVPKNYVSVNVQWQDAYLKPGTQIPTQPPLVVGKPVQKGQSVGNEGINIFVSDFLPVNDTATYMGCYNSAPNNDNMTFIGGSPPTTTVSTIENGNFDEPTLSNNTYQYVTSASTVPNWYFGGACLLNNSTAWGFPIPYPSGNQCVCIQSSTYIYQLLNLSVGITYSLTFNACGRNCCAGTTANPVSVQLYTNLNAFISTIETITPPINSWTPYTITFTVPSTQAYNLYFTGTTTDDQSTAIQTISLSGGTSSSGTYTYEQCQTAAIQQGYQYFALQNVNTSTATGYCAVTNSNPAVSQYGNATTASKSIVLWSSKTSNQTGNTAQLNTTGSLQVLNTSGQAVYSSPSTNANPTNYMGCYADSSTSPAMTSYDSGAQEYDMAQCQSAAQQGGYSYFGLQNSTSGTTAQCMMSNDLAQATQYGMATNCTQISDGSWSGGGLSNAIYNSNSADGNFYLILQDGGNMCIYRGTGPNDNQGLIWSTGTNGKQQQSNPQMAAVNGKYGQNWMPSGSTLSPGDFIGSNSGDIALVMQTDGNLVLYTYQMKTNCSKMSDGNIGGGVGANASYNIGAVSIPGNMGKLAYIDGDSNLHTYPSGNMSFTNNYSIFSDSDNCGNDIQGASFSNTNINACETACNNNSDCGGFVFDNQTSTCYPKTTDVYPYGGGTISNSGTSTLYVRNIVPQTLPEGVSQNTNSIDTITYQNYINGEEIGTQTQFGLSKASNLQKQQLQALQTKLNLLSNQITNLTDLFQNNTNVAEQQSQQNASGIENYLIELKETALKTASVTKSNMQNILNESDIVVLQKNYEYLFWSILATGAVLITMSMTKK